MQPVWRAAVILMCFAQSALSQEQPPTVVRQVVLVRGASGAAEYGAMFDLWSSRWNESAKRGGCQVVAIGPSEQQPGSGDADDFVRLHDVLKVASDDAVSELWVVLIGHGTFDGKTARFNLRGPDLSSSELKQALGHRKGATVIVNCSSGSSPFLSELAGPRRVVITATKAGSEQNFARFGDYFSSAIGDQKHDLDKDGQTSLLEAFLAASRQTASFYESDGRLETEHALLDDNGDGHGLRADWYRGLRLVKKPDHGKLADGMRAQQFHLVLSPSEQRLSPEARQARDEAVQAVYKLRQRKAEFAKEEEYLRELETLCVRIAELDEGRRGKLGQ